LGRSGIALSDDLKNWFSFKYFNYSSFKTNNMKQTLLTLSLVLWAVASQAQGVSFKTTMPGP
jgi:hypothetical protein